MPLSTHVRFGGTKYWLHLFNPFHTSGSIYITILKAGGAMTYQQFISWIIIQRAPFSLKPIMSLCFLFVFSHLQVYARK